MDTDDKSISNDKSTEEIKIPKKRGRKPKNKLMKMVVHLKKKLQRKGEENQK